MRGDHASIRHTWGYGLPTGEWPGYPDTPHLQFFIGEATSWLLYAEQITHLSVEDDYEHLPQKTRAILQWFLEKPYDHIYLCDTDTFTRPERLIHSGYEQFDYSGVFGKVHPIGSKFDYNDGRNQLHEVSPWASGGVGYFLSRRAAEAVVQCEPDHWAEDFWIGQVIGPLVQSGALTAADLPNFECNTSWHFPKRVYGSSYDPKYQWQEEMEVLEGQNYTKRAEQYKRKIPIIGEKIDPLIEALDSGSRVLPAGRIQRIAIEDQTDKNRIESARRFKELRIRLGGRR